LPQLTSNAESELPNQDHVPLVFHRQEHDGRPMSDRLELILAAVGQTHLLDLHRKHPAFECDGHPVSPLSPPRSHTTRSRTPPAARTGRRDPRRRRARPAEGGSTARRAPGRRGGGGGPPPRAPPGPRRWMPP